MGLDIVGLEPDGCLVSRDRIVAPADRLQCKGHVVSAFRNAVIDRERAADHLHRGVRLIPVAEQ